MNILKTLLLFLAISTQTLWAQSYIAQTDSFFMANKIISPEENSLCGPVSFMNWLIYENKINPNKAYELLKKLNQEEKNGINHGHTSDQLISFIDHAEKKIDTRDFYESKSYSQLDLEDIVKKGPQILLLKFTALPKNVYKHSKNSSYEDNYGDDSSANDLIHFVFKLPAGNGRIELIDPMQPTKKIIIGLKKEGEKILLSDEHYQYFGYAGLLGAHTVQVIEVISRRD